MMKKLLSVCLVFWSLALVSADWQVLDESAKVGEKIKVKLLDSRETEMKIEITVSGYYLEEVMADQTSCFTVDIPGSSVLMQEGYPTVSKLGKLICLPKDCEVSLEVLSIVEIESDLPGLIVPSKGHLTRDINPKDIEFKFASVYEQDAYWPAKQEQFSLGKPFQFRDVRGIRLRVLPARFNHLQKKMKILQKAVLALKFHSKDDSKISYQPISASKTYDKIYDMFLGYPNLRKNSKQDGRKLVVVTPARYKETIQPWIDWKQKAGYEVTIHTTSKRDRSFEIKEHLKDLYDYPSTRFDYVVLIGDASYSGYFENCQPMPTFEGEKEGAAADRVYVRLDGYDNYPEACISRISGESEEEIANQLDKIIQYEQSPLTSNWSQKGICVASDEGHHKDWQRAEWLQNGGSKSQNVSIEKNGLLANGFTSFADVYDPGANPAKITEALNDGSSIICYIGHGTPTSWYTSGFNNDDIHNLTNKGLYPVIWSVACVNGKFVHLKECFAEAWLRKKEGGAVAVEAASTNESWAPPCDKQAATINSIINKSASTFGAQELVGCLKAMEIWGDDDSSEGNKMAEQCNLFGDCTLMTRYGQQAPLEVKVSYEANTAVFHVTSKERALTNAIVTIYSEDFRYRVSQDVELNGKATIALDSHSKDKLFYTVVSPNCIPLVDIPLE